MPFAYVLLMLGVWMRNKLGFSSDSSCLLQGFIPILSLEMLANHSHLLEIDNNDLRLPSFGLTLLRCKIDRRAGKPRRDPIAHTNIGPWWGQVLERHREV